MKKKLLLKRILSVIIAVALLVSAIPISLAVQNLLAEATTSKIVREVTELREESVKHFLCEDGSYIAATYSAPVHYQENGEWKEIDNSLSLDQTTLSKSGKPTYTTKSGGLSVSIPQDFSDEQKITAQNKGYEIEFSVNSNQKDVSLKTAASVVELKTLSSNAKAVKANDVNNDKNVTKSSALDSNETEAYNAEIMAVDNQSSAIIYKDILPDTDFEYIVTGNSIKENIVIYKPQSEYTYSFDMNFDGLTPIVNPDNSISLIEPNNPNEKVFFIEAPYMYDSNSEESIDIEMSLVSNGDEYVMTLVASAEWINDENRAFPVVIDPTIYIWGSDLDDVFVIDGLFANSPRINNELRVGRNLTNVARTYIKPELPANIPLGSRIDSAVLKLYKDSYYQAPSSDYISVYAYDCSGVATWESDEISWNNQPYNNANNGYRSTNGAARLSEERVFAAKEEYDFDIKFAVQQWVNGGVNNGLMLVSSDENLKSQIDFVSSRSSDSTKWPQISIQYRASGTDINEWTPEKEASSCTVFVTSAILDWTATSNQSWLTVPVKNTSSFVIAVSENTAAQERSGLITVAIGDTVISTIEVVQLGVSPYLHISKEVLTLDYQKTDNYFVPVTTNAEWDIEDSEFELDWLTARKANSGAGIEISVSMNAEEDLTLTEEELQNRIIYETRSATITLATDTGVKDEITVVQLNEPLSYFNTINNDGSLTLNSSSEYNHALATWAMELSYAAYNPISNSEAIPGIPGSFREPPFDNDEWTAKAILESKGFEATMFNYEDCNSVAAHVIGHRTIEYNNIEINNDNLIGEIENDGFTLEYRNDTMAVRGRTHSIDSLDSGAVNSENLGITSVLNSEDLDRENSTDRQLVVVDVRGSVTFPDWIMDFLTQFHVKAFDFETGRDMVLKSLYGYDCCTKCDGDDDECVCNGYLALNDINNPVFLVTGHSMGAAIANLVAAELNEIEGADDVYGYTFATPTVKSAIDGNATIPYSNIFNILNTNDVVPYVPTSWLLPGVNLWSRYGIDIPLNMPFNNEQETDVWGLKPHSMAVYMKWMNDHEGITYEEILEESSEATVRGLLPKILQVKCPVSVSIKDSDGRLIAYESQKDNLFTQSVVTDTGIVSWITDDGAKMFFIPAGVDTESVEIKANGYGTMDFAIGTAGTTNESEIKMFNDVLLYPEKEFTVEISDDVLPENSRLFVVTENGEVVGEVTDTNPFFKGVTVEQSDVVYGEPVTFTLVTDNTVTAMMLHNVNADDHVNLVPGEGDFNVEVSGENELTWTVTNYSDIMNIGENVYDISVQSNGVWYFYENVIAVNVTVT